MIELKPCCKVPFPEKLFEQYEVKENAIIANVNASKVVDMMKRFIVMHDEPLFFILEIPTLMTDEEEITPGILSNCHKDVYYLDGCTQDEAFVLLEQLGSFLVTDGMNTFGFGGHRSHEEILFEKYNLLTVITDYTEAYRILFAEYGIEQTDSLVTAWDTFTPEHGGECMIFEANGKTIYDIPIEYEEYGLYLAERRED